MEGRLTGFSLTPDGGAQNITVTVAADFREAYDELKDEAVEIEIKKAQDHRSLQANRYCWVLVDKIAAKSHLKKSEVYRNAIREIGGVSKEMLMKCDAVPMFRRIWESQGLGNQVELVDVEEETEWASIRVYFGSSTYDTEQMSALLESLNQDAEARGIPTITPKEEERMLQRWGKKNQKKENRHDQDQTVGTEAGSAVQDH